MASLHKVKQMLARGNVQGLCRALKDPNLLVQRGAARALGELRNAAAVPCLANVLRSSTDDYVVQHAIEALGLIGTEAALDALIIAMFSRSKRTATFAEGKLAQVAEPRTQLARAISEMLMRSDWDALRSAGSEAAPILALVMRSEQYDGWPAARRKEIAAIALEMGTVPISGNESREFAEMGVFVSGVHTLGDLLKALRSPSSTTRAAAAEKLGQSGLGILATWPLYRQFRREIASLENAEVAAMIAGALEKLGDMRAIEIYRQMLSTGDGPYAAEAARGLALIGSRTALEVLFRFAANPPPPPAYRNTKVVLSAMDTLGPHAVDVLLEAGTPQTPAERRLIAELVARLRHPEAILILTDMARDSDADVQHAALEGLVALNSAAAALAIRDLSGDIPRERVIDALAHITDVVGAQYLRAIAPDATVVSGRVFDERANPLPDAGVQFVIETYPEGAPGVVWQPISARATTAGAGEFVISLPEYDPEEHLYLKVITPRRTGAGSMAYVGEVSLRRGENNDITARLDPFMVRLNIS